MQRRLQQKLPPVRQQPRPIVLHAFPQSLDRFLDHIGTAEDHWSGRSQRPSGYAIQPLEQVVKQFIHRPSIAVARPAQLLLQPFQPRLLLRHYRSPLLLHALPSPRSL
ncbi:hypothetical protein HRbin36_02018 [bacterium HR36]|nr:hypothetical protein HRbin36_02018 [bacterium HR36]